MTEIKITSKSPAKKCRELFNFKTTFSSVVTTALAQASRENKSAYFTSADISYLICKQYGKELNNQEWTDLSWTVSSSISGMKNSKSSEIKFSNKRMHGFYKELNENDSGMRSNAFRWGFGKIEQGVNLDTIKENALSIAVSVENQQDVAKALIDMARRLNIKQLSLAIGAMGKMLHDKHIEQTIEATAAKKQLDKMKKMLGLEEA